MTSRTGRYAFLEQLRADGVTYMFGNPGTVEQGFLDSLEDFPDIQYIFGLQETIAVAMADGYARATLQPTIVQLHSGVGLGNGVGMLYQAKRGNAPLVVFAGESGVRYDAMDAQMAADLVAIAKPVTKWSTRVVDPTSLLRVIRRAIKMAVTPPMGPVFVALPMDVLDAYISDAVQPTTMIRTSVAPDEAAVHEAAAMLVEAQRPMIIMGDGITQSRAQAELAQVAELLGADVWGANSSEVNMAASHPLFRGSLGHMFGDHSREITSQADAILICGTYVFPEVFPALEGVFAPDAKVVHIDLDSYEIAKNFPVDLGLLGDAKTSLAKLATALDALASTQQREAATRRITAAAADREEERAAAIATDRSHESDVPLQPAGFMRALAERLPPDVIVVDEALTVSPDVTRYLVPDVPGHFFQTRGGSLGIGIPTAIGVKLANPDKTVIGFSGDGGSMYTIQALWTAAHHKVNAKFVITNNRSYKLLKLNIQQYWRERDLPERDWPFSFDISDPELDFAGMARSMGVEATRVTTPDEIGPAIDAALAHDGPYLIDLIISDDVPSHIVHIKGGQ